MLVIELFAFRPVERVE